MIGKKAVRPPFALLLTLSLLAIPAILIASPFTDRLADDLGRWMSRKSQLEAAKEVLAQRPALEKLAVGLERDLDEGSLFYRGSDVAAIQNAVQSSIRATVQSAGATVRLLDARSEPGESRRRLTIKLTAEGGNESLNMVIARLEAVRPRLLLRDLHLHGTEAAAGTGMTLDLEIDAYADLSPS
ncbi:MAG TPA: type II secretion system protein GspM [Magnetospirillaceae bacterium]|nr:type II secretion system protein GspM [Magnetospirillaceae bacterium]